MGARSFRAFCVFRGYNVSVNICVRDYNRVIIRVLIGAIIRELIRVIIKGNNKGC